VAGGLLQSRKQKNGTRVGNETAARFRCFTIIYHVKNSYNKRQRGRTKQNKEERREKKPMPGERFLSVIIVIAYIIESIIMAHHFPGKPCFATQSYSK
jgi:hypothetical protein